MNAEKTVKNANCSPIFHRTECAGREIGEYLVMGWWGSCAINRRWVMITDCHVGKTIDDITIIHMYNGWIPLIHASSWPIQRPRKHRKASNKRSIGWAFTTFHKQYRKSRSGIYFITYLSLCFLLLTIKAFSQNRSSFRLSHRFEGYMRHFRFSLFLCCCQNFRYIRVERIGINSGECRVKSILQAFSFSKQLINN